MWSLKIEEPKHLSHCRFVLWNRCISELQILILESFPHKVPGQVIVVDVEAAGLRMAIILPGLHFQFLLTRLTLANRKESIPCSWSQNVWQCGK